MMTYRLQLLAGAAALLAAPKDDGAKAEAPVQAPTADAALGLDPAALDAAAPKPLTAGQRREALAERELALAEAELEARELEVAARRAAALAGAAPATIKTDAEDPAEVARRDEREARRMELVLDRKLATDPSTRRALARELTDLELDELSDFTADLREHGTSLMAVLRKAANNAFGVVL